MRQIILRFGRIGVRNMRKTMKNRARKKHREERQGERERERREITRT